MTNASLAQRLGRHKIAVSNIGLVLLLVLGGSYLLLSIMRVNPMQSTYTVTIDMDRSGGLQPNNDVTLRGYRVGQVKSIELTDKGVAAVAEIDSSTKIPAGGTVAVRALSAAGEQYIDFRPHSDSGPYLDDGSVVRNGVETPLPVSTVLANSSDLIGQIEPDKFAVILTELDKALSGGPGQLRGIVNGLSLASAGLDGLLPQTTNLLTNLRTIAATTSNAQPDLGILTRNSRILFDQATAADGELRALLDNAPGQMAVLGSVLNQTQNPLTDVAHDFVAITKAAQLRTSALSMLFPTLRTFSTALGMPAHDGNFNTIVDIWSRPSCDYDMTPIPPSIIANEGRVRLWNYCSTRNPALQVRGAANAPRPNVPDNGAHMPPGVDPNQMSRQLPDPSTW